MPEYIDPKSEYLEVDSEYASTIGTDTTSLVDDHVFENGRRFHGRLAVWFPVCRLSRSRLGASMFRELMVFLGY